MKIPAARSRINDNGGLPTAPWYSFFADVGRALAALVVTPTVPTPAGGATNAVLLFGTAAGFGIYYGSGAPTVVAAQGSLYLRSDGSSTANRMYVNTDGASAWTAVSTVS